MKHLFLAAFAIIWAFSATAFSHDAYLCSAHCGFIMPAEQRPNQGFDLELIMASSSISTEVAFIKLKAKCEKGKKMYNRLSAFTRHLGNNSLGADGIFERNSKSEATEANSCIKLGD